MNPRMIERLLRSYPPSWRERYGAELRALLDDEHGSWRVSLDVLRAGVTQRLRSAALLGADAPADERRRAGVLLVLCSWSLFVVAGCAYAKLTEHWQAVTPDESRSVAAAAFNIMLLTSELGTVAVLFGIAAGLPAFVRLLRSGGWAAIRRPIFRAALVTAATLVVSGGLVIWAQQLSATQRNGSDWLYSTGFVLWALFVFASIALWTAAAVAAARRIQLTPARLRLEARVAYAVTTAMLVMTVAALVWWGSVTSPASAQMSVLALAMVTASALAIAGSARSLKQA